jgi:probable phosphoglycerate mutase
MQHKTVLAYSCIAVLGSGLIGIVSSSAQDRPATGAPAASPVAPAATSAYTPPARRRIYLMRHGDVSYFDTQGKPVPDPDQVVLNDKGKVQSDAAGKWLAGQGIKKFDRVVTSHLPRTVETADRVLAAGAIEGKPQRVAALREIKSMSGASRTTPTEQLPATFLAFTQARVAADTKFLGGETAGEMQARVYAAVDALLAEPGWDTALIVLHGIVNNAILSRALTGSPEYFGRFEASAGCLHILDAGPSGDWIVRAFNLCPDPESYGGPRLSVMEKLLVQVLKGRR